MATPLQANHLLLFQGLCNQREWNQFPTTTAIKHELLAKALAVDTAPDINTFLLRLAGFEHLARGKVGRYPKHVAQLFTCFDDTLAELNAFLERNHHVALGQTFIQNLREDLDQAAPPILTHFQNTSLKPLPFETKGPTPSFYHKPHKYT